MGGQTDDPIFQENSLCPGRPAWDHNNSIKNAHHVNRQGIFVVFRGAGSRQNYNSQKQGTSFIAKSNNFKCYLLELFADAIALHFN